MHGWRHLEAEEGPWSLGQCAGAKAGADAEMLGQGQALPSDQSLSPYSRGKIKSSWQRKERKQHGENGDWLSIYSKGRVQKQLTTLNCQACYVPLREMGTELTDIKFLQKYSYCTVMADFAFCNSNFYLLPDTRGLLLFCNERNLATTGITSSLDVSVCKEDAGLLVNIVLS